MADVMTLLSQFVDALNAGEQPDAEAFISRAESLDERKELAGLIDQSLTLAPESAIHPRDAGGSFVSPVSRGQIDAIVAQALNAPRGWDIALPEWRVDAGLSEEALAGKVLAAGGFEATAANVGAAKRWIDQMERGMLGVRDVSQAALATIAGALKRSLKEVISEGAVESPSALAFRTDLEDTKLVAMKLANITDVLDEALAGEQSPVDHWFSGA